jgi:hypothetical protein
MKYNKDKNVKKYFAGGAFLIPAAISAGQAIYGGIQAQKAKDAANRLKMPSTATPDEYAQMMKAAYDSQLMERQLDEINRSMATSVNALQQGGGRALIGGLPAVQRAANQATFEAGQFENQQRLAALGEMAGAKEREMGRGMDVYNQQLGMAQAALNAGVQTAAQGIGGLGSSLMYGADAFTQGGGVDSIKSAIDARKSGMQAKQTPTISIPQTRSGISDNGIRVQKQTGMPKISDIAPSATSLKSKSLTPSYNLPIGLDIEMQSGMPQIPYAMQESIYDNFGRRFKEGGMMTGGKFDHKTNPIDIVQKGKKVGEMTGGEVILNPAQASKLSKESAYFRTLLKKFNKK